MSVLDVAKFILENCGPMSAMKLQKLVYYSQAWHLVWDDEPLFADKIQAWANGPVSPRLYANHRGQFLVQADGMPGESGNLNDAQIETVSNVIKFYGEKSGQWLSDLTHIEKPWLEAREGLQPGDRSSTEITHSAMSEYYGSL